MPSRMKSHTQANKERIALTRKETAVGLTQEEKQRLETFQLFVQKKVKEAVPPPFSILHAPDEEAAT
jgi:hypothetical protein